MDIGFLETMVAIAIYLAPPDINKVQMWPYASDSKESKRELTLTYVKGTSGWCPEDEETNKALCIVLNDGKLIDDNGKVFLDTKTNLKVKNGTNYVLYPKNWDNPLKFSVRDDKGSRTFEIKDDGKTVRELRAKMSKSHLKSPSPDEYAWPEHDTDPNPWPKGKDASKLLHDRFAMASTNSLGTATDIVAIKKVIVAHKEPQQVEIQKIRWLSASSIMASVRTESAAFYYIVKKKKNNWEIVTYYMLWVN